MKKKSTVTDRQPVHNRLGQHKHAYAHAHTHNRFPVLLHTEGIMVSVTSLVSNRRWSTIARGVIEGGQRSPWVHMGGGQGSPAVHWDAVNDRKGCIELEFD